MEIYSYVLAGFIVGTVIGLSGVGGGSLMTPILIFFFGIKPYLAVGTDLLFAAFTKMGGTFKLIRGKQLDWPVVLNLSAGSIPAALLTLYAVDKIGIASATLQKAMTLSLGFALLLTAAATLYKAVRGSSRPATQAKANEANAGSVAAKPVHWSLPLVFGAAIGALVTLTSVGAGAIGVTVLMLLYPLLPINRIVAADIAYAVPLTLIAGLGHASLGSVDWPLLAKLLAGSLPGIWLGLHLSSFTSERLVRALLSTLLAFAGLKLVTL